MTNMLEENFIIDYPETFHHYEYVKNRAFKTDNISYENNQSKNKSVIELSKKMKKLDAELNAYKNYIE